MSYVAIWLQSCLHWRCAYFQTLSWNDTIFVVDWDILYKLCGLANKCSKGFVFSGKIWCQFFSCNKACSKYHTRSTTTPKYTLTQCLVINILQLIFQIPQSHRNVFTYISAFLRELLLYSNDNKLDAKTLGEYNLFASYFFRYVFAQYHIVDTFIREISMKSC